MQSSKLFQRALKEPTKEPIFKLKKSPDVWVWGEYRDDNAPGGLPCPDDIHTNPKVRVYFTVVDKKIVLPLLVRCILDPRIEKLTNENKLSNENVKALQRCLPDALPDTFIRKCQIKREEFKKAAPTAHLFAMPQSYGGPQK